MRVGFVGVGKLGKDVVEVIHDSGYDVTGYDVAPVKTYIKMASSLADAVVGKDIVFVALPTPHHKDYDGRYPTSHLRPKDFDYGTVKKVIGTIDKLVDHKTLIVLISTVLPGRVRRHIVPLIKHGRFIYNPYLIAQGTVKYDMVKPEMVIIGTEDGSISEDAKTLKEFYKDIVVEGTRFEVGTWEEAESIKIFYNTFISTKLSLVNMIADVSERLGHMNVDVVTNALKNSTDRIMGPKYMSAGLGDGGGCHPRDNIALRSLALELDLGYDLFDAIMLAREKQALNMAKIIKGIANYRVCILGSGFKPGVIQLEGSPAILLGYQLEKIMKLTENSLCVWYDKHPKEITEPLIYVMHDHNKFKDFDFNKDSVIFDPFGKTEQTSDLTKRGIRVYNYGRGNNV